MEKTLPNVGDKLYLQQQTGNYWVDIVKRPYTVIDVSTTKIIIRNCELIFAPNNHYYNSLPIEIKDDVKGRIEELTWHPKKGLWGTKGRESDYPAYAYFGEWEYYPYLN